MSDELLRMICGIELEAAASDKPRRLAITAYHGDVMTVEGFGPVVIALNGMNLPASVPILSDHENKLASVIAGGTPSITSGTLSIKATLADSPAAAQVVSLLAGGIALQASVGAQPIARRFIAAGETTQANGRSIKAGERGLLLIEKSALREISITPVGADANTSVRLAASRKGTENMTDTTPELIRAAERQRLAEIDKLCTGLSLSGGKGDEAAALRARAIVGEIELPALQAGLLDLVRSSRASRPCYPLAARPTPPARSTSPPP